jgi:hypothetical protein
MRGNCIAALCAALVLLTAGPAAADVYDDNPAAATRGPGDMYFFARADDGSVLEKHWTGSGWSDWSSIGGYATSGPAAAGYGNTIQVFVRGGDGAIYWNVLSGGSWRGWQSLGGVATSAPAAAVRRGPLGYLDLAVRGTDNAIWFQTFVPGKGWSGWSSIGGNLTTAPTLDSQADGIVNVFARGTDGTLFQKSWDGAKWIEWFTLGGGLNGAPTSVSRAPGFVNVYARGGNQTYIRSWAGTWGAWTLLDSTPIDSSPAPVGQDAEHEAIAARRGRNLWLKSWTAQSGFGPWVDLGPIAVPAAAPAPAPLPDGEVGLETGLRCTPPGGKLRVNIKVRKKKGKAKPRVSKIVFFTKGKGRRVRVDRKSPFTVRITINKAAGQTGRVYARVYYRRSKHGPLHRKTVSRRYVVCG